MKKFLVLSLLLAFVLDCSTSDSARRISASGDPEDIFFEKEQQGGDIHADSGSGEDELAEPKDKKASKKEIMASIDEDLSADKEAQDLKDALLEEKEELEKISREITSKKQPKERDIKNTYTAVSGEGFDETGYASWYGPRFHGKKTASGEIFNKDGLTAAHPTLPMGTEVRIYNFDNKKEVVVKINDRGPFSGNRVIDLSERAAEVLNFVHAGTAKVGIKVLNRPEGGLAVEEEAASATDDEEAELTSAILGSEVQTKSAKVFPSSYYIQLGVFNERDRAVQIQNELGAEYGEKTVIMERDGQYVVQMGNFSNRPEAEKLRDRMKEKGIDCFIPKK